MVSIRLLAVASGRNDRTCSLMEAYLQKGEREQREREFTQCKFEEPKAERNAIEQ